MYITTPKRKNGSTVVRLVECFRKEGKIKTRIVKTLGQSKDKQVIEYYKKTARKLLDEHKKGFYNLKKISDAKPQLPSISLNPNPYYLTGTPVSLNWYLFPAPLLMASVYL